MIIKKYYPGEAVHIHIESLIILSRKKMGDYHQKG